MIKNIGDIKISKAKLLGDIGMIKSSHAAKISPAQIKAMKDEEIKAILTREKSVNGTLSIALQNALTIELSERAIKKASEPHWSIVPNLCIGFAAMVTAGIAAYFAVYPRSPQPVPVIHSSPASKQSVQSVVSSSRKQLVHTQLQLSTTRKKKP